MRLVKKTAVLLLLVAGCTSAEDSPVDAGLPDAGDCPAGQVRGPLGSCLDDGTDAGVSCKASCASTPDCAEGSECVAIDGCTQCRPRCSLNTCASTGDCCSGFPCEAVEVARPNCGICQRFDEQCGEASLCDEGFVCAPVEVSCGCDGPTANLCVPDCRTAGCNEGLRCGTDGVCQPIPCTDGFSCTALQECVFPQGDAHGCRGRACVSDAGCPGGACVNGACSSQPGRCRIPAP